MPDESRVKPQPLQPEAKPLPEWELAAVLSNLEGFVKSFGGRAVASRILATIEEARREQPVSDAVQAVEALSVMYDEYGGKVPADVLRAILDNFERNAPARREQPVRVTDADSLRAALNTVEFRNEVHPFLIEYVRKFNQTSPVGYSFDSTDRYFWDRVLLVIGDYLAAAPKEARNGG